MRPLNGLFSHPSLFRFMASDFLTEISYPRNFAESCAFVIRVFSSESSSFSWSRINVLKFAFFQTFRIFRHNQVVDAVLDVSVHEGGEIVDGVVDAVVRDASLRIVVGAFLGGAVASADHRLTLGG